MSGFGVWITGMPASGKSSVTRELVAKLRDSGVPVVVLESDVLRKILTPDATYALDERDRFYAALASLGEMIAKSGVNVIFDATANRRAYREQARALIPKFIEVYVQCPLEVCVKRDPKGIYRRAAEGGITTVPGAQQPYEPPMHPEVVLDCQDSPGPGAVVILDKLKQLLYI
jgi:adenylylsulfate kinase